MGTKLNWALGATLCLFGVSLCRQEESPPRAGPVPAQICILAAKTIGKMQAAGGADVAFEGAGRATMRRSSWNMLDWKEKQTLARMLAYDAACPNGDPNSQYVAVRDISTNKVLASGTVASFAERDD